MRPGSGSWLRSAASAAVLLLAGTLAAPAADVTLYRINGAVDTASYPGFARALDEAVDSIIGLKVSFEQVDSGQDDTLQAYEDGDLFVAFLPSQDEGTQVSSTGGYAYQHGFFVFDGFFLVKYGGFNQGISALVLEPVDEAQVILSGARITDVTVDTLDPSVFKR
ncbi:hypothetical protein [Roseibium aestuarii]|uniref:Uncharacterized protein n=1 Tax=Roseibium aestuarii TaxID=2600299 RepID=A0ABW4K0G4_9HYPH|nr:hypothetical protein [Roseibium aestuarii]